MTATCMNNHLLSSNATRLLVRSLIDTNRKDTGIVWDFDTISSVFFLLLFLGIVGQSLGVKWRDY